MKRPLVGVTADLRTYDNSLMHTVGDKYARAVWEAAGCTPIIIPAMAESQQVMDMLDSLDGLLFTGSPPTSIRHATARNPASATSPRKTIYPSASSAPSLKRCTAETNSRDRP